MYTYPTQAEIKESFNNFKVLEKSAFHGLNNIS